MQPTTTFWQKLFASEFEIDEKFRPLCTLVLVAFGLGYLIVLKLFSAFPNMFSHQTAMYNWAHKQWWVRMMSTVTSEGVYHYLHHSKEVEHNQKRGNLVNIGGGLFFFWDRVFGTYRPVTEHRPKVGLQGVEAEALSTNPLRLAFAGISQIVYELVNNRGWKTRWHILVGGSDYVPPVTRDFALRSRRS